MLSVVLSLHQERRTCRILGVSRLGRSLKLEHQPNATGGVQINPVFFYMSLLESYAVGFLVR